MIEHLVLDVLIFMFGAGVGGAVVAVILLTAIRNYFITELVDDVDSDEKAGKLREAGFKVEAEHPPLSWRCGRCSKMISGTKLGVHVPEDVLSTDPLSAVQEVMRQATDFVVWCVPCASKFLTNKG